MSNDQRLPSNSLNEGLTMTLQAFRGQPSITLDMKALKEGESRLIEAKTVTPVTYVDLEHTFGEAYRELKRNLATIGYQIMKAENELEKSKASALLDKYPEFLKDKPKGYDVSDVKKAFLARDIEVTEAKERLDTLKTLEIFLEGKVKVMENVSRYMKKQMELVLRSGIDPKIYYRKGE